MPRYKHPSKYYADDKDISDLLLAEKFSAKRLVGLIRERGIFINPTLAKETLVSYLSQIPFSWPELQKLMEEVQSPDAEEKVTTCQAHTLSTLEDLIGYVDQVKDLREETFGEAWTIHSSGEGDRVFVRIKYSEMDNAQTRTLQRIQREMEVAVEKSDSGLEFRFPINQRAENIVDKIIAVLPPMPGEEKVKRTTVDLAGVVDPHQRTKFFVLLMDGMVNYKRRDVLDLRMNRMDEEEEDDDDAEKAAAAERIKRAVKKMTLTGESLLLTPEFKDLDQRGFFISKTVWLTRENTGAGAVYEIEAQFKQAEAGTGFCYILKGMRIIDADNEVGTARKEIPLDARKKLHSTVEVAAYAAVEKLRQEIESAQVAGNLTK